MYAPFVRSPHAGQGRAEEVKLCPWIDDCDIFYSDPDTSWEAEGTVIRRADGLRGSFSQESDVIAGQPAQGPHPGSCR
jgi:hypothetical protein